MAKRSKANKSSERYFNEKRRIKNKTKKLEKLISKLENRKEEVINPNTKLPAKRGSVDNLKKSCRVGRDIEGFNQEDFKHKKSKIAPRGIKNA